MRICQKFLDALFVSVLLLYVLAGVTLAPYHGDESTIIHKGRDVFLLLEGNFAAILYTPNPGDQRVEQELRLVNGVISEYGIGIVAWLTGLTIKDIPDQWLWGADWNFNRDNGHMAGTQMLFVSRMSSALMTMLSVALVFVVAKLIGGRRSAYLATLIYTLMPAVLLDGRRAMFEGATLLAIGLVLLAGVILARRVEYSAARWQDWLLLGLVAGFGVASKHTLVVTILPVFAALVYFGRHNLISNLGYLTGAGAIAIGTFLILNPAWWSAPLAIPPQVIQLRQEMATGQADFYGTYSNATDRLTAVVTQVMAPPQYYEDKRGWPEWIGGQIANYEVLGLQGVGWGTIPLVILLLVSIVAWAIPGVPRPTGIAFILFACVFVFSLIVIYVLTNVPWQRYYLPLAALFAIFYGLSLDLVWKQLGLRFRSQDAR